MRSTALACLGGLMLISAPILAGHGFAQTAGPAPAPAQKAAKGKAAAPQGEAAKPDPAAAERAMEAGIKAYEAGKNDQAAQALSGAMQGGALPGPKMARALYYRGLAYKKSGKPAQAISDLTSALWLKGGLSESERTDALAQRESAYQEAGIAQAPAVTTAAAKATTAASAAPAAPRAAAASAAPPPPAAPAAIATAAVTGNPVEPPPAQKEEKSSGGFFSNLFGSSSSPAPAAAGAPAAAAPAPEPAASSWNSATKASTGAKPTTPAPPQAASQASPAKPAAQVATAATTVAPAAVGNYRLQVAAVRSRAEAEAVAARLKKEFAKKLGNRQAVIDEAAIGNMGTFYRVRVGPYANANEPRQLCITLRASGGYDCMVVTQ